MRAISLKLTEHLDQKLTALVRRRRSNRSTVLREALEAFTGGRAVKPSVTAAATGLVGSLQGPADLSTAVAHLAGYGK